MDSTTKPATENATELTLPGGCVLCGRDLAVRVTPSGAVSCCTACWWISRPRMQLSREGIKVAYQPAGWA